METNPQKETQKQREMPFDTTSERLVKARKLHRCDHCGLPIVPKETYFLANWLSYEDGCGECQGFASTSLHPECVKVYASRFSKEDGLIIEPDNLGKRALEEDADRDDYHVARIAFQAAKINYTKETK